MSRILKIGTRDSQLAVWQASLVQQQLLQNGHRSELVYIKSEGDIDLVTPLYEIGVQGIFTRTLDAALLSKKIDIAVHSMKDVPTLLAKGICSAAVLPRASYKDLLLYKNDLSFLDDAVPAVIATSSIRRKAQWLNRYPHHRIDNLRGNVNTRLRKLAENSWNGAIFAAAGLERIQLRPEQSVELDWMLPAPAQGAIMVVCNEGDNEVIEACHKLHDQQTALCTQIERDFLRTLMGGCSTPISALASIEQNRLYFKGSILSLDGKEKVATEKQLLLDAGEQQLHSLGITAANEVLENGGKTIVEVIRNAAK